MFDHHHHSHDDDNMDDGSDENVIATKTTDTSSSSTFACGKTAGNGCSRTNSNAVETKPLAETAFRIEEKKYKLYKPQKMNRRLVEAPATDFSEVLDFRNIESNHEMHRGKIHRIDTAEAAAAAATSGNGSSDGVPCFVHDSLPGLVFFPALLSMREQKEWVRRCMTEFTGPPHPNNESTLLMQQQQQQQQQKQREQNDEKQLQPHPRRERCDDDDDDDGDNKRAHLESRSAAAITPPAMMAGYRPGLRWATLGYSYNWTAKSYHPDHKSPFPVELSRLCSCIVQQHFAKVSDAAAALARGYKAETAIVNYFPTGSQMCAHQDVSETALSRPLVSISLGCSAVFLMGTESRDDKPTAMWLRSGDVVVFSGKVREAFHAVPRVMDDCPAELLAAEVGGVRGVRLNINVRQVYEQAKNEEAK